MTDEVVAAHFAALEPHVDRIEVLEARVLAALERTREPEELPSIAREWLELLSARPIANGALVAVASALLLSALPASLIASLLRAL